MSILQIIDRQPSVWGGFWYTVGVGAELRADVFVSSRGELTSIKNVRYLGRTVRRVSKLRERMVADLRDLIEAQIEENEDHKLE